jgi:hypothetical protein
LNRLQYYPLPAIVLFGPSPKASFGQSGIPELCSKINLKLQSEKLPQM